MQHLPVSLQEAIFRCDNDSQNVLGQTCQVFWRLYHELVCVQRSGSAQHNSSTARAYWRIVSTEQSAATLARQFRVGMELRPLTTTMITGSSRCYHISLVGHLDLSHLKFILQHPDLLGADLHHAFGSRVANCLSRIIDLMSSQTTQVVMLTLKVYHSRQDGFSDFELDQLGRLFRALPDEISCYLAEADFEPLTLVCEPVWQLVSPAQVTSCMPWIVQDPDYIAELSEVCGG